MASRAQGRIRAWLVPAICAVLALAVSARAEDETKSFTVSQTYDGHSFSYEMTLHANKAQYDIYRLSYPSPVTTALAANNTIPAEYYLPHHTGTEPRPAVVCLHILNGDFSLVRLLCSVLALRGVPAIMFKLPYYGERGAAQGRARLLSDAGLFGQALTQGLEDVRRTVDVLASRPEVDPGKVGVAGISLGGIMAGAAAGADPRLHRAVLILAGGDILRITHHARETRALSESINRLKGPERKRVEDVLSTVDPSRYTTRLRSLGAAGRVLMINAAEDEVVPRECTQGLADAIGISDRVVWLPGLGHYTAMAALPQVLDRTAAFFAADVAEAEPAPAPADAAEQPPLQVLGALVRDFCTIVSGDPGPGRCHFLDLTGKVTTRGDKTETGQARLIRGTGGAFRLEVRLPKVGAAALGQSTYPWMAAKEKVVFRGVNDPVAAASPAMYVAPEHLTRVRVVLGLLGALSLAPDAFAQWLSATRETSSDGATLIRVQLNKLAKGELQLFLQADGARPDRLAFAINGTQGTLTFRQWQVGTVAVSGLFDEPRGVPAQDVSQHDVYRSFAALFEFALEISQ